MAQRFREFFSNANGTTHCNVDLTRIATLGDNPLKEAAKVLINQCLGLLEHMINGTYDEQCQGNVPLNALGYSTSAELACVEGSSRDQDFINCLCDRLSTGGNDSDYRLGLAITIAALVFFSIIIIGLVYCKIAGCSMPSWRSCWPSRSNAENQQLTS